MVVLMKRVFVTYLNFLSDLSHDVLLQLRTNLPNTEHGFLVLLVVMSPFIDVVPPPFFSLLCLLLFVSCALRCTGRHSAPRHH